MRLFQLCPLLSITLASHLVVLPSPADLACATYHGLVGASHLYHLPSNCIVPTDVTPTPFSWPRTGRLMWASPTALDSSVPALVSRRDLLAFSALVAEQSTAQLRLGLSPPDQVRTVLALPGDQGQLVVFPSDDSLRTWTSDPLRAFTELVFISPVPLPSPLVHTLDSLYPPPVAVPAADVARIRAHLKALKFNSLISTLITTFPRKPFIKDVKYLSGEDQKAKRGQGWVSRHSMSEGGHRASDWIVGQFRATGLDCEQHEYANGFAPMIECVINGTDPSAGTFVLGGHFDSRGSFGYPTAPGADDDGSGTALLLSIARHITSHRLTFKRKVIIAAFSGEEQGLLGSNWHARRLKESGEDIVLMVQADMIGYRKPGEPRQIAFPPDSLGLQEARFLVGNLSTLYAPELVPGITPACCSDHQSFGSLGFASTWVFERNGPIADPFYHNSGDLSEREGYDFEQIYLTSTVVLATLLEVAGFAFI